MAIDNAEKRRSAATVGQVYMPAGVTPNATPDAEWRQQVGWTYSGNPVSAAILNKLRNLLPLAHPEENLASVTPANSSDLLNAGVLYIGVTGNVKVDTINSGTEIFVEVQGGTWIDRVRVKKVYSTGTTATNILVAY